MVYIKAEVGPSNYGDPKGQFTVRYYDEKGNMTIRSGGTRAWRCNNPGNLLASPYSTSKKRRSIGQAGDGANEYAIYPDYETGHEALVVMLKGGVYSPLSLRAAIKRYDSTNPKYIDEIVAITGFDPERTIRSLSDKEFEMFWKAIEKVEKWKVGREDFIEKWYISGVHKKRGVITEYLVKKKSASTWTSKEEALKLAMEGRLHAIVVHLKTGHAYLRPEFGSKPFELIS
ncbi:MAG: hypothetical protein ACM3JI_05615 [Anaerolineae bacterium]